MLHTITSFKLRRLAITLCYSLFIGPSYGAIAEAATLRWERADVGAGEGAFVAIAGDPQQPAHLFAASQQTLYESLDSGGAWQPRFHPPAGIHITAFAIEPSNHPRLVVATDRGLYGSADEGETWQRLFQGSNPAEADGTVVAFQPR